MFKRALEIREKILGPDHPDLVTTLKNYAVLLRKLNREAEPELLEVRAARLEEFKA